MKVDKRVFIAVAAGVTIAGIVALLSTEKGKKLSKKWKYKGEGFAGKMDDIINDAKQKISELKKEFIRECNKAEKLTEEYS